jgi:pilus assembly protein CpaB
MVNLTKIVAGLLVVVAALLGIFAWTLTRHAAPPPATASVVPPTFAVVVAAHPLHAGEALTAADLQVAQLSLDPPGSHADVTSLVGRVPLSDLGTGLPIVESTLLAGLAGRLAPGERAVAIKVDELAGVGGRVRPGDSVDLFMLLRRDGIEGEIGRTQARLLLSKVRVLAYGRAAVTGSGGSNATPVADTAKEANPMAAAANNSAQVDAGTPPGGNPGSNDPVNAHTAVVAVPVEQVDALALADSAGRLVMALRNPSDTQVVDHDTFAQTGTVLIPAGGQAALATAPSNRAAAGLLLDQLVSDKGGKGSKGGNPNTAPLPVLAALPTLSGRSARSPAAIGRTSSGGVEVIRGDKREMVGW